MDWLGSVAMQRNVRVWTVGSSDDYVNVGRIPRACPRLTQPSYAQDIECIVELKPHLVV